MNRDSFKTIFQNGDKARHNEAHEFALAPGLAPLGNADENGANKYEPSRASAPAPIGAELVSPRGVQKADEDGITRAQRRHDVSRRLNATQTQPCVNTKAVEATSYSAPSNGSPLPYAHDHNDDYEGKDVDNHQFEKNVMRQRSVRGSMDNDTADRRNYYNHGQGNHAKILNHDAQIVKDTRDEKRIAPPALQPTNGGTENAGEAFKHSDDFEEGEDLGEASISHDEDDPDAIYRITSTPDAPFGTPGTGSVRLSKEEYKAEKKEMKARKRQKLVKDPVTGQSIWIENARGSTKKFMASDGVIAPKYASVNRQSERSAAEILSQLYKVPFKDDKTNLLFYPMNPPEWKELLAESQRALFQWGYILIFVLLTVQVVLSPFSVVFALWVNAIVATSSILFVKNRIETHFSETFQEAERVRGEHATLNALPESVEWLNNILRTIWPTINPELFAGPVDLLEDVLQKQVPGVVHTVKVSDLDIGSVPLRVLSMRYLPDDGAPRGDEDASGEYVNLEVSFGYRAGKSDKSLTSKAKNIHLLIWFLLGLKNVLGIPLPIWVEVLGIMGKARVRIQLLPDPPFLKNGTITLLGMPKIELSTIPVSTYFINVMNLPFVSQLVSFAVKTICKDLIAPRSYTLDVSKLMVGDDVKKETASIGIVMICLHGATDVPRADHRPGRSKVDPYATVQYSRFGKSLYSTRVISQDYNPVWEETCFLPILPAAVKAGEKIRVNLWDSDRISADDLLGRVEVDLTNLVKNPGTFERRIDKVVGCPKTRLHWSIGFFGKKKIPDQVVPKLVDSKIPAELRNSADFKEKEPVWSVDSKTEQLICRIPPDQDYPGILSIQIHQINDLGMIAPKSSTHTSNGRVLDAEAVEQGKEDDSGSAPSSYCAVTLNDELVYKTRTRAYTNRPIFNASFERFVRSFGDTRIRITVRDQRFREDDPIIGILPLALSEELKNHGQVTRWYPLSEGIGYGQIRVSILFRNLDCKLPRTLQGWNLCTLHIYSIRAFVNAEDADALQDCSLRIDTMLGHKTIGAVHSIKEADGSVKWDLGGPLVMAIRRRHATSINFECHRGGVPFTKKGLFSGIYGASIIALSGLEDDRRNRVRIPLFQTDDYVRFKQNSLTQAGDQKDRALIKLGYLEIDGILKSGLSTAHRKFAKRSNDLAQTHESWETEKSYHKRMAYDARQERKEANGKKSKMSQNLGEIPEEDTAAAVVVHDGSNGRKIQLAAGSTGTPPPDSSALNPTSPAKPGAESLGVPDSIELDPETEWDDDDDDDDASYSSRASGHRSLREWIADKAEKRRERHRRHRGIMQQKPARTASWMKNGLRRGISKASRALSINREDNFVEREA